MGRSLCVCVAQASRPPKEFETRWLISRRRNSGKLENGLTLTRSGLDRERPLLAPLSRSAKDRNLPRRSRLERLSRSTHVPRACWRFSCRPRAVPSTPAGIMRRRDRPARSAAMAPGEPYRDRTPAAAFSLRISPPGARASRARACERRLPRASGSLRSHWRR